MKDTTPTPVHKEFCSRLPEDLLIVENPESGERIKMIPGDLRDRLVRVGAHIPPEPENLNSFLTRYSESYLPDKFSKIQRIIAIAAGHHRLLWIHPFLDGNGRVSRLVSYATLQREGIGNYLWSIARGLARNISEYKELLMEADESRKGSLDGRGSLSESNLHKFCVFFLQTCIDQVEYMTSLLNLNEFLKRMERFTYEQIESKILPKGSFSVLREAFLMGEIKRSQITEITGYKERSAREIVSTLLKKKLLVSDHKKDNLRLGFPLEAIERYFPGLYPELNLTKQKLLD